MHITRLGRPAAILLALVFVTGFQGCSLVTPKAPDQIVFDATTAYGVALSAETQYAKLPRCPAPAPCSDKATVAKVKTISNATWTSIQAAQRTVRAPGFGDNVYESAANAAINAANAYKDIAAALPRKQP